MYLTPLLYEAVRRFSTGLIEQMLKSALYACTKYILTSTLLIWNDIMKRA
ncbi:hypothetical protein BH11BAC2_BH11BAC2_03870 [soil metagenome]